MLRKLWIPALLSAMSLTGCATYHLSTGELLEQFAGSQREKKINVLVVPPFFFYPGVVNGNSLRTLTVHDKHNRQVVIPVTNRTGIRFTKTDSTRTTFYFDTLLLKDSTITGSKTHFFNAQIRPIKFSNISRIEVQR